MRWVQASPQHAAAMAALEQAWRRLDALRSLCPRDGDTPDPDLLAPDTGRKDTDGG
jgi:ferric-dicitrate binding protein FerR (iron transport regulator)